MLLAAHRLASHRATGDVFGAPGTVVAAMRHVTKRADDAEKAPKLARITLREARHTYASLMIAAGVNAKALSTYMGHANIAITLDRYGHLTPGNEPEAATLLDSCLDRAVQEPRSARSGSAPAAPSCLCSSHALLQLSHLAVADAEH